MKGLTFKLDYFTLFVLIVLPAVAFYYLRPKQFLIATPLLLVPAGLQALWLYDLNRNLCEILSIKHKFTGMMICFLALSLVGDLFHVYFYCEKMVLRNMGETEHASLMTEYMLYSNGFRFFILCPVYIISIVRVKKFLYLRSWAFVILEVLVVFIGLVTLRPTLEEEYAEWSQANQTSSDMAS